MDNCQLVMAAREYAKRKVKFRHRGRSNFSLDCAGLMVRSYADCGVDIHDFTLYGPEPFNDGLVTHTSIAFGAPIKLAPITMADLADGDIVLFRFHKHPHHLAMIASAQYGNIASFNIIHADGETGHVLEQRLTPDMAERITHQFRRPI